MKLRGGVVYDLLVEDAIAEGLRKEIIAVEWASTKDGRAVCHLDLSDPAILSAIDDLVTEVDPTGANESLTTAEKAVFNAFGWVIVVYAEDADKVEFLWAPKKESKFIHNLLKAS